MVRLLYFAWVRDAVGAGEEAITVPESVTTVSDLADHLAARGAGYAEAFADRARLRVAVDQVMAKFDTAIAGAGEIAFFPPVTGG